MREPSEALGLTRRDGRNTDVWRSFPQKSLRGYPQLHASLRAAFVANDGTALRACGCRDSTPRPGQRPRRSTALAKPQTNKSPLELVCTWRDWLRTSVRCNLSGRAKARRREQIPPTANSNRKCHGAEHIIGCPCPAGPLSNPLVYRAAFSKNCPATFNPGGTTHDQSQTVYRHRSGPCGNARCWPQAGHGRQQGPDWHLHAHQVLDPLDLGRREHGEGIHRTRL